MRGMLERPQTATSAPLNHNKHLGGGGAARVRPLLLVLLLRGVRRVAPAVGARRRVLVVRVQRVANGGRGALLRVALQQHAAVRRGCLLAVGCCVVVGRLAGGGARLLSG